MTASPLRRFAPSEQDPDWETIRARFMANLLSKAPVDQSDHNAMDPGVTITEAIAFALADLHYRAAERRLDDGSAGRRAWDSLPLSPFPYGRTDPRPLSSLARALSVVLDGKGTTAGTRLERIVRTATSRDEARHLAREDGLDLIFTFAEIETAITLARLPLLTQTALEHTDLIALAVDQHMGAAGVDVEAAADELRLDVGLWHEELAALVRREVNRRAEESARRTSPSADAVLPEDFEDVRGATLVWPPHAVQALTCEPITLEDYACRARSHPNVHRAWAVPGRLGGIRWDGFDMPEAEIDPDALGTVTLVVDFATSPEDPSGALREVLTVALGEENRYAQITAKPPFAGPRRVMCDEVGAAHLRYAHITLRGTLLIGTAVNAPEVIAGARARVEAYFDAGRPESRELEVERSLFDGPWPHVGQPNAGWNPGESVRFTEITQAIMADSAIRGVEKLALRSNDGAWVEEPTLTLELARDQIPVLAHRDCISTQLELERKCGRA